MCGTSDSSTCDLVGAAHSSETASARAAQKRRRRTRECSSPRMCRGAPAALLALWSAAWLPTATPHAEPEARSGRHTALGSRQVPPTCSAVRLLVVLDVLGAAGADGTVVWNVIRMRLGSRNTCNVKSVLTRGPPRAGPRLGKADKAPPWAGRPRRDPRGQIRVVGTWNCKAPSGGLTFDGSLHQPIRGRGTARYKCSPAGLATLVAGRRVNIADRSRGSARDSLLVTLPAPPTAVAARLLRLCPATCSSATRCNIWP